ncbi:FtsQ-type POTRA domain-containing protein [Clostridium sp.]|uniref:cell division protein FtsQ/DivIB n=1 Tax=Clostridium sp. TaxID=1506 RepID=UPI001A555A44|nr:FtsQ-type POTRA domain-containing protein [Clostridium sp.]MBK5241273.1 FtsQ-type POTRA domain-containing protein [Clostridium sp.]
MKDNNNSIDKGNYIIAHSENLLKKRKKKKKVRKLMLLVIIMVSTLVTLCLKLPYFNITNVEITGNINVSNAKINEQVSAHLNNNIFYASFEDSKKQIIENPYTLDVKIKKKLPNKILIEIEERVAVFYGKVNDIYYIIDNQGKLLEQRSNIKDMNIVNLVGLNLEKCKVGDAILSDDRKIEIANDIANIINDYRKTKDNIIISSVDISDVLDVKAFSGKMCIKLGTSEDLENKFNRAIIILSQPKYKAATGYVDVRYKANPVAFIED